MAIEIYGEKIDVSNYGTLGLFYYGGKILPVMSYVDFTAESIIENSKKQCIPQEGFAQIMNDLLNKSKKQLESKFSGIDSGNKRDEVRLQLRNSQNFAKDMIFYFSNK